MLARVIEGLAGLLVAGITLRDVFYTVVVPGNTRGLLRVSRRLVRIALPLGRRGRNRGIALNFAPIVLVGSFATWMLLLVFGFGLVMHALADSFAPPLDGFGHALYVAGGSMTTIGFGTADAHGLARGAVVVTGFCGLSIMTLAVTYLLEVQGNIAQRDVGVLKLTTTSGKPPSAVVLLERYALLGDRDELRAVLKDGREWCAAVLQSHASHPWLVYFRSVGTASGWPAALGTLMDVALIAEWLIDDHALRGQAVLAREEADRLAFELVGLLRLDVQPAPVRTEDARRLCERLVAAGYRMRDDRDLAGFLAAREEHASRIDALAQHLGSLPSPLVPGSTR